LGAARRCGGVARRVGDGQNRLCAGLYRSFRGPCGGKAEEIPSPTFTLVQIYEFGDSVIYHFDLYRLEAPTDAYELGIEDAFGDSISLIEWPDRLGGLLPEDRLDIELQDGADEDARNVHVTGAGAWSNRMNEIFPDD
jgi:tRNA threonylcarbamoyladenosine biosynthesis protein TsaE